MVRDADPQVILLPVNSCLQTAALTGLKAVAQTCASGLLFLLALRAVRLPLQDELQFLRVRSAKQEIMVSARMSLARSPWQQIFNLLGMCTVRLHRAQHWYLHVHAAFACTFLAFSEACIVLPACRCRLHIGGDSGNRRTSCGKVKGTDIIVTRYYYKGGNP